MGHSKGRHSKVAKRVWKKGGIRKSESAKMKRKIITCNNRKGSGKVGGND